MKPKSLIWILLALMALIVILLFQRSADTAKKRQATLEATSNTTARQPANNLTSPFPSIGTTSSPTPLPLPTPDKRDRWKELQDDVERGNKPINFWARVVDQDDQPLAGAVIVFEVRAWRTIVQPAKMASPVFREHRLVSDTAGLVKLVGEHGEAAGIKGGLSGVRLDGYIMSEASRRRLLSSSQNGALFPQSSADNPIIIKMWRKLSAEQLVKTEKGLSVPCDGTPVYLDLVTGKFGTNPAPCDMILILQREPQDLLRGQIKQCNWSLDIQMPEGGLQTNATEFPYLAPMDGYTNRLYQAYLTNEASWKRVEELDLFIHNRGGRHYGNVKMRIVGDWSEGPVIFLRFEATINPAGSRNLEYDWKLRVEPQKTVTSSNPTLPPSAPKLASPPSAASFQISPAQPGAPAFPQPPLGFQDFTNRAKAFAPPVPTRPQPQ